MQEWLTAIPGLPLLPELINKQHGLNRGRVLWCLCVSGLEGGKTWWDITGSPYINGVLTNMTATSGWRGSARQGGYGHLLFDGTDDYVRFTRNTTLNSAFDGDHTVALWMRNSSSGTTQRLWEMRDASTGIHSCIFNFATAGTLLWFEGSGNNVDALGAASTGLNDGAWRRYMFSLNGSTQTLYINGAQDNSRTRVAGTSADSDLCVGTQPAVPQQYFPGSIDSFSIWNRGLSAAEAAQDYLIERGGLLGVLARPLPRLWPGPPGVGGPTTQDAAILGHF